MFVLNYSDDKNRSKVSETNIREQASFMEQLGVQVGMIAQSVQPCQVSELNPIMEFVRSVLKWTQFQQTRKRIWNGRNA